MHCIGLPQNTNYTHNTPIRIIQQPCACVTVVCVARRPPAFVMSNMPPSSLSVFLFPIQPPPPPPPKNTCCPGPCRGVLPMPLCLWLRPSHCPRSSRLRLPSASLCQDLLHPRPQAHAYPSGGGMRAAYDHSPPRPPPPPLRLAHHLRCSRAAWLGMGAKPLQPCPLAPAPRQSRASPRGHLCTTAALCVRGQGVAPPVPGPARRPVWHHQLGMPTRTPARPLMASAARRCWAA